MIDSWLASFCLLEKNEVGTSWRAFKDKIQLSSTLRPRSLDGPGMKRPNIFVKVAKQLWRRNKGSGWLVLCVGMDCWWRCLYRLDLLVTGPGPTTNPLQISSHSHHSTSSINWDKVSPDTAPGQHYHSAGITRLAFGRMWYITRSEIWSRYLMTVFSKMTVMRKCIRDMRGGLEAVKSPIQWNICDLQCGSYSYCSTVEGNKFI